MSSQSVASAKRRRAGNINNTPIFKPEDQPASAPVESPMNNQNINPVSNTNVNPKKPMSLQQVISVFDQRLLHLEKLMIENGNKVPVTRVVTNDTSTTNRLHELNKLHNEFTLSLNELKGSLDNNVNEFDHRYNLLANEIVNLKQIILKLQSYTLDVNKVIIKEHLQLLNENKDQMKVETNDEFNLQSDINAIKDEGIQEILEEELEQVEEDTQEDEKKTEENVQEDNEKKAEENITQNIVELDPIYNKDAEPWDQESTTPSQILEDLNNQNLDINISSSVQEADDKKGKRKKKEKKSMSVVIEDS